MTLAGAVVGRRRRRGREEWRTQFPRQTVDG